MLFRADGHWEVFAAKESLELFYIALLRGERLKAGRFPQTIYPQPAQGGIQSVLYQMVEDAFLVVSAYSWVLAEDDTSSTLGWTLPWVLIPAPPGSAERAAGAGSSGELLPQVAAQSLA